MAFNISSISPVKAKECQKPSGIKNSKLYVNIGVL